MKIGNMTVRDLFSIYYNNTTEKACKILDMEETAYLVLMDKMGFTRSITHKKYDTKVKDLIKELNK